MDIKSNARTKSVKESSKFYVECPPDIKIKNRSKSSSIGHFWRSKSEKNIHAAVLRPSSRDSDDLPYIDQELTLKKSSWFSKKIKVDSVPELAVLSRNDAVRNFISSTNSSNKKGEINRSTENLNLQRQESLSKDANNSDLHDDEYYQEYEDIESSISSTTRDTRSIIESKFHQTKSMSNVSTYNENVRINTSRTTFFKPYLKDNHIYATRNDVICMPDHSEYDRISAILVENEIVEPPPPIRPRRNIPQVISKYEPDNSEYDQILSVDGFKEKEEVRTFNSYIKNSIINSTPSSEVRPDEPEYDEIIDILPPIRPKSKNFQQFTPTSQSDNSKQDRILSNDNFDKQKSRSYTSFKTTLSRTQSMTIKELVDTEATYLSKLKHLIEKYLLHFRKTNISPNIELVFGNIEELHRRTEKMYPELNRSSSIDDIAKLFISNIDIFDCYADFIRNKALSHQWATKAFDQLIKDRQDELNDTHTCASYLLDPIQRPGRYKLFLEKLLKELTASDESYNLLRKTIALLDENMQEANTKLAIDCIQWCPVNLNKMGNFLLKDIFNTNSEKEIVAFLFEECIVCCTADKVNYDRYDFVNCIELENLSLRHCEWSTSFEISRFDKSKTYPDHNEFQFHLEASVMSVKEAWVNEIHKILWDQLRYCKDQLALNLNRQKELEDSECPYEKIDGTAFHKEIEMFGEGEYYSIGKVVYEESRRTIGTFFDKDFCPRIEIISSDTQTAEYIYTTTILPTQRELLIELIAAEEAFLKDSKECIDAFYSSSEDTSSYERILFSNIKEIYNETEKLYLNLLKCDKIDGIAISFLESARLFDHHTDYVRNKSAYDYIRMEFKNKVNKTEQDIEKEVEKKWSDYLICLLLKPPKYKTFLEKLRSQLGQVGQDFKSLRKAIKFVNDKIDNTITLMNIDTIRKCPFDLASMGKFLKKDTFNMRNQCECELFLFEQIVVICLRDHHHPNTYLYYDSVDIDKLAIIDCGDSPEFQLKSFRPHKAGRKVDSTFNMISVSMLKKNKWIEDIQKLIGF